MEHTTMGAFTRAHDDNEGYYMPLWTLERETAEQACKRWGDEAMIVAVERFTDNGWPYIRLEDPKGTGLANFWPHGSFGADAPLHPVALTSSELHLLRAGLDALETCATAYPEDAAILRTLRSKLEGGEGGT